MEIGKRRTAAVRVTSHADGSCRVESDSSDFISSALERELHFRQQSRVRTSIVGETLIKLVNCRYVDSTAFIFDRSSDRVTNHHREQAVFSAAIWLLLPLYYPNEVIETSFKR